MYKYYLLHGKRLKYESLRELSSGVKEPTGSMPKWHASDPGSSLGSVFGLDLFVLTSPLDFWGRYDVLTQEIHLMS